MIRPDDIRDALAKITADPDETMRVIDQEIASLELEIEQLLKARKLVTGRKKRPDKVAKTQTGTGSLGKQQSSELEQSIVDYLTSNGPATCSDIAEHLGVIPVVVGTAVKKSERLFKDGSYVNLHDDSSADE